MTSLWHSDGSSKCAAQHKLLALKCGQSEDLILGNWETTSMVPHLEFWISNAKKHQQMSIVEEPQDDKVAHIDNAMYQQMSGYQKLVQKTARNHALHQVCLISCNNLEE